MAKEIKIEEIRPNVKLIWLQMPMPGYEPFFGTYVFTGEKKALVEVGPSSALPSLRAGLKQLGIGLEQIEYVLLTHIHLDHAGGAGALMKDMPGAKLIAHTRSVPHLVDPTRLWQASVQTLGDLALKFGEMEPVPGDKIIPATDGMKVDLGNGMVLELIFTPGHAPHHLSIFERSSRLLIAGEAAGTCVNGNLRLVTPPPFRLEEMLASLDKLIALAPETICYAHFGCYNKGLDRMQRIRQKLLEWYEFIGAEARKGKSRDEILAQVIATDRSLDYLKQLPQPEYEREYGFVFNSVRGIYGAVTEQK